MGRLFLTIMTAFLPFILTRKSWIWLTRWSFRPATVRTVPASSRTITWWGRRASPFTFPVPQLVAQAIYFLLQLSCLLIIWGMTPSLWMTPLSTLSVVRLHHNAWGMLPISPSLQVNKLVLSQGANWFLPILAYVSYKYSGRVHHTLLFPQTVLIVRTKRSWRPNPLRTVSCTIQPWPKSIKFVRGGNEQQERALPEDEDREENVNFIE